MFEILYIAKILTNLDQNRIRYKIINPNEKMINSDKVYNDCVSFIKILTKIFHNKQYIPKNYIFGKEDALLKNVLRKFVFNLKSLISGGYLLFYQPYFKEDVYTYLCILKEIKNCFNDKKIICCGTYFSVNSINLLERYPFIDYILDFYPGDSVSKIIQRTQNKDIDSITYINKNGIGKNRISEKTIIPNYYILIKNRKILPIEYAYGCPYDCFFCDYKNIVQQFQMKDINNLIDEIKFYYKKGIKYLWIHDPSINFNEDHLRKFCITLIKNKLDCKWSAPLIPSLLRKSTFNLMSRAGCIHLRMGVETVDEEILKTFNKFVCLRSVEKVLKNSSKANIKNTLSFMIGLPGEGVDENFSKMRFIEKNIRYINSVKLYIFQLRRNTKVLKMADKFNLKPREDSKDNRYLEYDEIHGLTWEKIQEKHQLLYGEMISFLRENKIPNIIPEKYFVKLIINNTPKR